MKDNNAAYGGLILRVVVGLLFLVPGIFKLTAPAGAQSMLEGMGIPAAAVMVWLLILAEVLGGLALILGVGTKYAVWPLVIVLVVATVTAVVPSFATDPMAMVNLLWHVTGIAALISLYLTGPGALSLAKKVM